MNHWPSGYEPDELPGCSTPRHWLKACLLYTILSNSQTKKTPYYSRNVRIDKLFGENYSVQSIKERIYGYKKVETMPFANYNKKYYKSKGD